MNLLVTEMTQNNALYIDSLKFQKFLGKNLKNSNYLVTSSYISSIKTWFRKLWENILKNIRLAYTTMTIWTTFPSFLLYFPAPKNLFLRRQSRVWFERYIRTSKFLDEATLSFCAVAPFIHRLSNVQIHTMRHCESTYSSDSTVKVDGLRKP